MYFSVFVYLHNFRYSLTLGIHFIVLRHSFYICCQIVLFFFVFANMLSCERVKKIPVNLNSARRDDGKNIFI